MKINYRPISSLHIFYFIIFSLICIACSSSKKITKKEAIEKIKFDISEIDNNGLVGPPDGKRALSYKFVIPFDEVKHKEIVAIDTSLQCHEQGSEENKAYSCIGSGATQEVLIKLARLQYIKKIDPCYWE